MGLRYFLAVDAGGTKTEAWLADETAVLARARSGSCKLLQVGETEATARLGALLDRVAAEAGVGLDGIAGTSMGLAGAGIPAVRAWAEALLRARVGGVQEVCGDDAIALDAAFEGGPGVLVIAGTGSAVVGRASDGTTVTAGGWGPAVGDEGSGLWIGREAVRRALQAYDLGTGTAGVLDCVADAWQVEGVPGIVGAANARGADFAGLVPGLAAAAEAGDRLARAVLEQAGQELARQVNVVWGGLRARGEHSAGMAYTGGVLEHVGPVRMAMRAALDPGLTLAGRAAVAPEGALWRARRLAG